MKVSILKEVKIKEGRVALVPENVKALCEAGHEVVVQNQAGVHSGFSDAAYEQAGAHLMADTEQVIAHADLVLKIKEPTIQEIKMMRPGQMYFGYLHLAAIPDTLQALLDQKVTALGYETLQLADGSLPLLSPMSEIAGKLAAQNGAHFLRFDQGGSGVLIGGTQTVAPAKVVVLGAGFVGQNAADVALGMGAEVTILDVSEDKLNSLRQGKYAGIARCHLEHSNADSIGSHVVEADLVIGAVLICGEKAPKLVTEELVKKMKPGSVIVDVSVDQGGCVETSEVTTHESPIVIKHGVLHYGVANMPGAVPYTSTLAINHAAFPYIKELCDLGLEEACKKYPEMVPAINCCDGGICLEVLRGLL